MDACVVKIMWIPMSNYGFKTGFHGKHLVLICFFQHYGLVYSLQKTWQHCFRLQRHLFAFCFRFNLSRKIFSSISEISRASSSLVRESFRPYISKIECLDSKIREMHSQINKQTPTAIPATRTTKAVKQLSIPRAFPVKSGQTCTVV